MSATSAVERAGHCLCGEVRFRTVGEPRLLTLCDCASCRRAAGAAGVAWSTWKPAQIRFTGTQPTEYASSPGRHRGFCGRCGSTVTWRADDDADHLDLAIALFDDAADLAPTERIWCADRLAWQDVESELPRHAGWRTTDGEEG